MNIAIFTFNPFQENTYLLFDETGECVIFDPGCFEGHEKLELDNFIASKNLRPVRLINTHCHLDHVYGNKFCAEKYGLPLETHRGEVPVLEAVPMVSQMYGIPYPEPSPMPSKFIQEGDVVEFGNTQLEVLFTPGHSPASLSFFNREHQILIAGDVLFRESIGRTDLPGGSFEVLEKSIREKIYPLGDGVKIYPGHGPETTVGWEKQHNPFVRV